MAAEAECCRYFHNAASLERNAMTNQRLLEIARVLLRVCIGVSFLSALADRLVCTAHLAPGLSVGATGRTSSNMSRNSTGSYQEDSFQESA
jgi:hypothetical protein